MVLATLSELAFLPASELVSTFLLESELLSAFLPETGLLPDLLLDTRLLSALLPETELVSPLLWESVLVKSTAAVLFRPIAGLPAGLSSSVAVECCFLTPAVLLMRVLDFSAS